MALLLGSRPPQIKCSKSPCSLVALSKCITCKKDFCMFHLQEDQRAHQFPPANDVQAQAYGDPHCIGFNNQRFDCHPSGDAILFKNSSIDFEIHARNQKVWNHSTDGPAVIKAIAIKVQSEKIEYGTDGILLIDEKSHKLDDIGIVTPKTHTSIIRENTYTFHVYTTLGVKVTVYSSGSYNLNITLTIPREHASSAEPSIFGNLNGENGKIVPATGLFSVKQPSTNGQVAPATDLVSLNQRSINVSLRTMGQRGASSVTNEKELKAHIEGVLAKENITDPDIVKNLVYDYVNIPGDIRDKVMQENINQVKDQIKVRTEQIEVQRQAGYNVTSLDMTQSDDGYLERLERRVSALETKMKPSYVAPFSTPQGRLEHLEERISQLEKNGTLIGNDAQHARMSFTRSSRREYC